MTHSYLSIAFAVAAMGLWAAWRSLKASVSVPHVVTTDDGSHLIVQRMVESHAALIEAAHLNKSAALLTALAAFLETLRASPPVSSRALCTRSERSLILGSRLSPSLA